MVSDAITTFMAGRRSQARCEAESNEVISTQGERMNWFKRTMLVGAVAAGFLLNACVAPVQGNRLAVASGSLALSSDDSTLYAVDSDNGLLAVIPLANPTKENIVKVNVGKNPVRVILGTDDTAYVANRGSNTVSVVRKGEASVSATLITALEPTGLALSPDGKTLLVASNAARDTAAEHGVLTAFDTATLQPSSGRFPSASEPRAVALIGNDRAVISLCKQGALVEVDLRKRRTVTPDPRRASLHRGERQFAASRTPRLVHVLARARTFSSSFSAPRRLRCRRHARRHPRFHAGGVGA